MMKTQSTSRSPADLGKSSRTQQAQRSLRHDALQAGCLVIGTTKQSKWAYLFPSIPSKADYFIRSASGEHGSQLITGFITSRRMNATELSDLKTLKRTLINTSYHYFQATHLLSPFLQKILISILETWNLFLGAKISNESTTTTLPGQRGKTRFTEI